MEKFRVNCLIIGAGVAGLAIGSRLAQIIDNIILIDKNNLIGEETSSRNSEVIHAGIYYPTDSLKAKLCVRGKNLLYEYLDENNILYNKCGKFILSTNKDENSQLSHIYEQAKNNGVHDLLFNHCDIKNYNFLRHADSLFSPSTGIFNSHGFINSLKENFISKGGIILNGNHCFNIDPNHKYFEASIYDKNNKESFILNTNLIVNAAGLNAYQIFNSLVPTKILEPKFMKGDYYAYSGDKVLKHLIYPLPTVESLGLHATIDLGSGIRFGPSAYEVKEISYSINEKQKNLFLNSVKKYWPSITKEEITPSYSGIRPNIKGEEDFLFDLQSWEDNTLLSILNYASPGLTSSLSMAEHCQHMLEEKF